MEKRDKKWFPSMRLVVCTSRLPPVARRRSIISWGTHQSGCVLLIGYELYRTVVEAIRRREGERDPEVVGELETMWGLLCNPGPFCVVLDEAHRIRKGSGMNGSSALVRALVSLQTRRRVAVTGSPVQNHLTEYYHMVQYVRPGHLGDFAHFQRTFHKPISQVWLSFH